MRAFGTTEDEVNDRTGWRRIVSAVATPQLIIIIITLIKQRNKQRSENETSTLAGVDSSHLWL